MQKQSLQKKQQQQLQQQQQQQEGAAKQQQQQESPDLSGMVIKRRVRHTDAPEPELAESEFEEPIPVAEWDGASFACAYTKSLLCGAVVCLSKHAKARQAALKATCDNTNVQQADVLL
jgi:hypothetical protein